MPKHPRKPVPSEWSRAYGCHPLVAAAIFSVAREGRRPFDIWMKPTEEEQEQVAGAMYQFLQEDAKQGYQVDRKGGKIVPKRAPYRELEPVVKEKEDDGKKPQRPRRKATRRNQRAS